MSVSGGSDSGGYSGAESGFTMSAGPVVEDMELDSTGGDPDESDKEDDNDENKEEEKEEEEEEKQPAGTRLWPAAYCWCKKPRPDEDPETADKLCCPYCLHSTFFPCIVIGQNTTISFQEEYCCHEKCGCCRTCCATKVRMGTRGCMCCWVGVFTSCFTPVPWPNPFLGFHTCCLRRMVIAKLNIWPKNMDEQCLGCCYCCSLMQEQMALEQDLRKLRASHLGKGRLLSPAFLDTDEAQDQLNEWAEEEKKKAEQAAIDEALRRSQTAGMVATSPSTTDRDVNDNEQTSLSSGLRGDDGVPIDPTAALEEEEEKVNGDAPRRKNNSNKGKAQKAKSATNDKKEQPNKDSSSKQTAEASSADEDSDDDSEADDSAGSDSEEEGPVTDAAGNTTQPNTLVNPNTDPTKHFDMCTRACTPAGKDQCVVM